MLGQKFSPDSSVNDSLLNILTGTGRAFGMQDCRQISGFIAYDSADPPTAGVVVAEFAPSATYTGRWGGPLNTWTLANIVAGTEDPSFTYPGPLPFIRLRFTTPSDKPVQGYVNGLRG